MELGKFLKLLRLNFKLVTITTFLSCCIFFLTYFLAPEIYLVEGTIYAYPVNNSNQKSEVSNELNYSRNLIALTNSPEFKKLIQDKNLAEYSFTPLVGVVGAVKLKEVSPNILSLSVTGYSENEALQKYKSYLNNLSIYAEFLKKGNSSFELSSFSEEPIINRNSKNLFQFLMLGFISGLFLSSLYLYKKR
jgi:hypothetical protein